MDFRADVRAQNAGDQFMFGPAFLVNPVTDRAATTRQLSLPGAKWCDVWTGSVVEGGRTISAIAPLDRLPLYVRAGSILPLGAVKSGPRRKLLTRSSFPFTAALTGTSRSTEDENDNYDYERGVYATIPVHGD
jgi:alpha-D-xyloside xylohydrolase